MGEGVVYTPAYSDIGPGLLFFPSLSWVFSAKNKTTIVVISLLQLFSAFSTRGRMNLKKEQKQLNIF